ncbi:MAG: MFS transporter [Candidatus Rokubacteria bacterium]|nr:MFS transporter [Candidatus Rokubacteria bacterium]
MAALCVTETITWGIIYYGFPVFLRAMEVDLGASRVAVTGAFSLGLAVSALAAIPVGRWLDRHGARSLMTLGSCLAAALVLLWSRVETTPALYAVWGLMGLAMAATLYEPAFAAVIQWFTTQRDRALLTLTLAAGLASTIFMPIEAWLLAKVGWRHALVLLGGFLAVTTIPIHLFALRPPPHLARRTDHTTPTAPVAPGMPLAGALRRGVFWVLAAAFFVSNFAHTSTTVHLIPYLEQYGYAAALAAAIIGWIGAMQLPGRLLFVPIASWLGARWVTAGIFVAQTAGMALVAALGWLPSVIPLIVLLGASNGMSTLARATIVSDIFGRRHYASISGAIALGVNGARALAPIGAYILYITLGSYERLFALLAVVLGLVSAGVLATNTSPPNDERAGTT